MIKFRWTVLDDLRLSVMCLFMYFKTSLLFKHTSTLATFKHHSYLYSMKRDIHLSEFGNNDIHTSFYYCLSISTYSLFQLVPNRRWQLWLYEQLLEQLQEWLSNPNLSNICVSDVAANHMYAGRTIIVIDKASRLILWNSSIILYTFYYLVVLYINAGLYWYGSRWNTIVCISPIFNNRSSERQLLVRSS